MVILSAIGRFFKKIWDWIKQTAWIQPLLIVGIIFGVIFSIPSIVKAVQAEKAASNEYQAYYHKFQISLELDDSSKKDSSPADKFTTSLEKVMKGGADATAEFKKNYSNLGEKFFVAYVSESCEKCKEAKDGFKLFQESLNKDNAFMSTNKDDAFNMVTIFTDEETSYTDDKETAFVKYLDRHQSFFEDVGSNAYQTDYYINGKLSDTDLEYLETADPVNFLTPTIFLVEIGSHVRTTGFVGVNEVMFGVTGEDQNAKAKTLLDCWNHTGDFSVNSTK